MNTYYSKKKQVRKEVDVEAEFISHIIGYKGSKVKKINEESKANVKFLNNKCIITATNQSSIDHAERLINEAIAIRRASSRPCTEHFLILLASFLPPGTAINDSPNSFSFVPFCGYLEQNHTEKEVYSLEFASNEPKEEEENLSKDLEKLSLSTTLSYVVVEKGGEELEKLVDVFAQDFTKHSSSFSENTAWRVEVSFGNALFRRIQYNKTSIETLESGKGFNTLFNNTLPPSSHSLLQKHLKEQYGEPTSKEYSMVVHLVEKNSKSKVSLQIGIDYAEGKLALEHVDRNNQKLIFVTVHHPKLAGFPTAPNHPKVDYRLRLQTQTRSTDELKEVVEELQSSWDTQESKFVKNNAPVVSSNNFTIDTIRIKTTERYLDKEMDHVYSLEVITDQWGEGKHAELTLRSNKIQVGQDAATVKGFVKELLNKTNELVRLPLFQ